MGLRRGHASRARSGPLHLAVERYVHCPRGGLVGLDRCEACELMQGMLIAEHLEVLCAYPEPIPALHLHAWGSSVGPKGTPAALATDERGDPALALAPPPARRRARRHAPARATTTLIFESDWPEE